MDLYGRTVIYSSVDFVDRTNIIDVLSAAIPIHSANVTQMNYLYDYYKGKQDIRNRADKTIRSDIDYRICENRCKEIVDFKEGYAIGDPIQYNDRTGANQNAINELNSIMDYEGRNHLDEQTVEWNLIAGTAYKIALPREEQEGISNIEIHSLDPRETFIIYSSGFRHERLCSVWFYTDSENNTYYLVYTPDKYYKVLNAEEIVEEADNGIGMIPIVEFPCNNARLGAFENIVGMQDALNLIDSDRVNAVAQFVQSLIVATNCNFEDGVTASAIMQSGIVRLTSADGIHQDIKVLTQELNQSQTQTLKQDIYNAILTICAMPNRNGGSSTSDTGIAVVYRDGWSAAETWQKKYEVVYKRAERLFLTVCCAIFDKVGGPKLNPSDIEVKFTRKNYENIYQKAQVFDLLSKNEFIAKRYPFILSGLFPDPEEAYKESLKDIEAAEAASREALNAPVREDA